MKITITDSDYSDCFYEGEDLSPVVDDRTERLYVVDYKGRPLAIYPRGSWYSVDVEYDDEGLDEEESTTEDQGVSREAVKPLMRRPLKGSYALAQEKLAQDIFNTYNLGDEQHVHWAAGGKLEDPEEAEESGPPSIGTAHIDIKPRLAFSADEVEDMPKDLGLDGLNITIHRD